MRIKIKVCNNILCFLENRPLFAWTLTIIYAGIIFYFSSQPKPLSNVPFFVVIPAFVKHIIEYIGLGVLLFISFLSVGREKKAALILAIIAAAIYGASDELHQFFVPGRVCSVIDWFADAIGGCIGSFFGISQKN